MKISKSNEITWKNGGLMQNKGGIMKFDAFFIGILIFSLFLVSGTFIIGNINSNYNINISTSEFNETYNKLDEMYNISITTKEKVVDAELEGTDQTIDSMTKGSYSGLREEVKNSFSLGGTIINNLASALNIPGFMVTFAITALSISTVLMVIFFIRGIRS